MAHLMYIWYITVGAVLLTFLYTFVRYLAEHHSARHSQHRHNHAHVGVLRERDIFFVPGDNLNDEDDENEE